jgi:hypothetical protein
MANQRHVDILLRDGVRVWNLWREEEPDIRPDLREADIREANLEGAHLQGADLSDADLTGARLSGADLSAANLTGVDLHEAYLRGADLTEADLTEADLRGALLTEAHLTGANLTEADLSGALILETDLTGADLSGADLSGALCLRTTFAGATLTGCTVYGMSAWNLNLDGAVQADLRITRWDAETTITVDNLEVAQFLYLLLHNENIRAVFDTVTSKVVLILGHFTPERKAVLDALRGALRGCGYVPVLFDFAGPASKDTTETVTLQARMARFVVADLTDPGSIPYELAKIVPDAHVPIQPLLLEGTTTFAMAVDLWRAREMLPAVYYRSPEALLATLPERVIAPAEAKVAEIQRERATALLRSGLSHPPLEGS